MTVRVITGDCRDVLRTLPDESVHCVVTSPPYWGLRDYGVENGIGIEATLIEHIENLVGVFREVRRALRSDGTLWLNYGDAYCSTDKWGGGGVTGKQTVDEAGNVPSWAVRKRKAHQPGIKPKDLFGLPWRLAFALQADGWWLRQDIIWSKPNAMPEPVTDRCTKSHEYLFLMTKADRYHFDQSAIAEPAAEPRITRNKRSVWEVGTAPFKGAHFATFPPELIEPCILAGVPEHGTVLDPFGGAGTTGLVADRLGRDAILIELNPAYADMARARIGADAPLLAKVAAE